MKFFYTPRISKNIPFSKLTAISPLSRARNLNNMMILFAGEGWGEGNIRMVIDDALWERLLKLLPKPKGRHGKNDRLFMEAIYWMLRTGASWRDLPSGYGI